MKKPQPVKLEDARDERALILNALEAWIKQHPGMDPYNCDRAGWISDARIIQRQRRDALDLLRAVRWMDDPNGVTVDRLKAAFDHAFSGRLTWDGDRLHYVTGQYWYTEYRAAAAAVLAYAIWDAWRATLPDGLDASGTVLREMARHRFGAGIQRRWFD